MALTDTQSTKTVLWCAAVYFFACGLSATFVPQTWLWASGLPTSVSNELALAFGVVGAYLSALGAGAVLAARAPEKSGTLILTLLIGNIFDFGVTLRAVLAGALPTANGVLFLVVTIVWSTLLSIAWIGSRRTMPCAGEEPVK